MPIITDRILIILILVSVWGFRLSSYIAWRNWRKGEDFRYQKFRENFGPQRYWWFSFFQVFLLQGILLWLISVSLWGALYSANENLFILDIIGVIVWSIGFIFEAGRDMPGIAAISLTVSIIGSFGVKQPAKNRIPATANTISQYSFQSFLQKIVFLRQIVLVIPNLSPPGYGLYFLPTSSSPAIAYNV